MQIFKIAYRVKRKSGSEIYKAFGFRHLSNVTHYYVHPYNQSPTGQTSLCQPIGEGITLLTELLRHLQGHGEGVTGQIFYSPDNEAVLVDVMLSNDWREEEVVEAQLYRYRIYANDEQVLISAYGLGGWGLSGNMAHLSPLYKLLACFTALLALDLKQNEHIRTLLLAYVDNPSPDLFVTLHEDFYQLHKNDDYIVEYGDLSNFNVTGFTPFSTRVYEVAKRNTQILSEPPFLPVQPFADDAFSPDMRALIPTVSAEYRMSPALAGLPNAITAGDVRSVLLCGQVGCGKTTAVRLLCEQIGLPLLTTVVCTETTDATLLGHTVCENGEAHFEPSPFTRAIQEGGAVLMEGINLAKPRRLAFLHPLLDDDGVVFLETGEVIPRHKNFRLFATLSREESGVGPLSQALFSRFDAVVELPDLLDTQLERMLLSCVPECEPMLDNLLCVYRTIRRKQRTGLRGYAITPYTLLHWARLARSIGYLHAAEKTLLASVEPNNASAEYIRRIVLQYEWE